MVTALGPEGPFKYPLRPNEFNELNYIYLIPAEAGIAILSAPGMGNGIKKIPNIPQRMKVSPGEYEAISKSQGCLSFSEDWIVLPYHLAVKRAPFSIKLPQRLPCRFKCVNLAL